jgi:hypothetical protein
MLSAMVQEHERGIGGWHAEWPTVPELVIVSAGAARAIGEALEHLVVDEERMRANLDLTRGLVLAEAVTMLLAERIGRADAYQRVERATRLAADNRASLADALMSDPIVTAHLTREEIEERLTPDVYLGALVLADECEHGAVEDLWLFPVGGVTDGGNHQPFRVRHPFEEELQRRHWHVHVGVASDEQRRHLNRLERREGDSVLRRLWWRRWAGRAAYTLEIKPALCARRVGGPIAGPEFPQIGRQLGELLWPQPASEFEVSLILHTDQTVGKHKAAQPLRKRQRIVGCDDATRSGAEQVHALETEMCQE